MPKPSSFRNTLRSYYVHVFCYDFIFGYAIFPAYFQLQGASPGLIGLLLAFWAAGIILLEIPCGLLSDVADRRLLLAAAPAAKAICFATWAIAGTHVALYFAGMFFWSLASALRSGTKEALLFEHVRANRMGRRYVSILGWERAFQDGATMLGAAAGGFIAYRNLQLALWVSLVPLIVSAVAALAMSDVRDRTARPLRLPLSTAVSLLNETWREFRVKPDVRYITAYVALCITFLGTIEDFNQLYFLAIDLPVWSFGIIACVIGVSKMALATQAGSLARFPAFAWATPLVCGAGLWLSGMVAGMQFLGLAALVLAYVVASPLHVLAMSRFQVTLTGGGRATTTSIMSMVIETLSVAFNLAVAFVMDRYSVLTAYQACGLYLVLFALWEMNRGPAKTSVIKRSG